jgi:hypothetical protein
MQWIRDLVHTDRLLRIELEGLSGIRRGNDLVSHEALQMGIRRIRSRVGEIRGTIDLHLSQNPGQRITVTRQVDRVLPVYSRLRKLLSLPP